MKLIKLFADIVILISLVGIILTMLLGFAPDTHLSKFSENLRFLLIFCYILIVGMGLLFLNAKIEERKRRRGKEECNEQKTD